MPRFAANLTFLFNEVPFLERFAEAAHAGFRAVECAFPYEVPAKDIAALLRQHRLEMALFNAPPGDWTAGDRGTRRCRATNTSSRQVSSPRFVMRRCWIAIACT